MVVGAAPILRDGRLVRAQERKAARGGEPPGPRVRGVSQGRPRGPGLCFWRGSWGEVLARPQEVAGFSDLLADSLWPGVTATPALPVGVLCRGPVRAPPVGVCRGSVRCLVGLPSVPPGRCLAGLRSVCPTRWFTQGSMSAFWLRGPWTLGRSSRGCVVQGLRS